MIQKLALLLFAALIAACNTKPSLAADVTAVPTNEAAAARAVAELKLEYDSVMAQHRGHGIAGIMRDFSRDFCSMYKLRQELVDLQKKSEAGRSNTFFHFKLNRRIDEVEDLLATEGYSRMKRREAFHCSYEPEVRLEMVTKMTALIAERIQEGEMFDRAVVRDAILHQLRFDIHPLVTAITENQYGDGRKYEEELVRYVHRIPPSWKLSVSELEIPEPMARRLGL